MSYDTIFASISKLIYSVGGEQQHTSGNKKAEEDASKDADEQLKHIKDAGSKTGDKVVEDLLKYVTEVKPEVPERVAAPPKS